MYKSAAHCQITNGIIIGSPPALLARRTLSHGDPPHHLFGGEKSGLRLAHKWASLG